MRNSELHDVEAKRARTGLPQELYKTLSAFGNREGGGLLFLGVDEANGFVCSGVADVRKAQNDLLNYSQNENELPGTAGNDHRGGRWGARSSP